MTESKKVSLLLDALFLARKLTYEAERAYNYRFFWRGDRLLRAAYKAWKRYNRRTSWFPDILPVSAKEPFNA